jgi:hypothetical protein
MISMFPFQNHKRNLDFILPILRKAFGPEGTRYSYNPSGRGRFHSKASFQNLPHGCLRVLELMILSGFMNSLQNFLSFNPDWMQGPRILARYETQMFALILA